MSFTFEKAQSLIGSSFIVHTSVGTVELRLIETEEMPRHNTPSQFRTPFVLIFSAPATPILSQDNYYIDHPELDRQFWTLAAVIPPSQAPITVDNVPLLYYQALFN
ncbi:hypothetical protein H8K52_07360 [Undibacterium seohonense]|jgi:hypothetical protein|uniref:DUF6916 domain-containing protein n=1 Tax=Undibacterium seohonense TaxID=1344950 RepID=A0ABR6X2Z3_9BURK|nr:hypothetical protein [Undibacterium seohonense]MBC3807161.1 hypothetical protein [Undibacterium seohonense]